jgi:hypothetical protein
MLRLWFVANTILWPFIIILGGFHLGLNAIVLMLAGAVWLGMRRKVAVNSAIIAVVLLVYLIFSYLVAVTGLCTDQISKLIITGPILIFLILIGFEAGQSSGSGDWIRLQSAAAWSILAAFSAFLVEMAVPSLFPGQAGYRSKGEYSGLFSEPSAVAFSLFPCVAVLLVAKSKETRRNGMLALLGLLVFSRSSTLLAMIAAWVLYRLVIRGRLLQAGLLALGLTSIIALGSAISYNVLVAPTVDRIVGIFASGETGNLSSLVYVQGWQDGWENLVRTHGLGLGFNMMGCHPLPDVPTRAVLALQGAGELNTQDGSIVFGKVISEAGVLGIVFYIAVIRWWVRLERRIRITEDGAERIAASTQAALIFCFVASSFIRGAGYFSGSLLLWVAAMAGASRWRGWHALKSKRHRRGSRGVDRAGQSCPLSEQTPDALFGG